jgi:hypothetical protein
MIAVPGGRVEYEDVPGDPALAPLLFLHEGRSFRDPPDRAAESSQPDLATIDRSDIGPNALDGAHPPTSQRSTTVRTRGCSRSDRRGRRSAISRRPTSPSSGRA